MSARTNPSKDRMGNAGKLGSDIVKTPQRTDWQRREWGGTAGTFHLEMIKYILRGRVKICEGQ